MWHKELTLVLGFPGAVGSLLCQRNDGSFVPVRPSVPVHQPLDTHRHTDTLPPVEKPGQQIQLLALHSELFDASSVCRLVSSVTLGVNRCCLELRGHYRRLALQGLDNTIGGLALSLSKSARRTL